MNSITLELPVFKNEEKRIWEIKHPVDGWVKLSTSMDILPTKEHVVAHYKNINKYVKPIFVEVKT